MKMKIKKFIFKLNIKSAFFLQFPIILNYNDVLLLLLIPSSSTEIINYIIYHATCAPILTPRVPA